MKPTTAECVKMKTPEEHDETTTCLRNLLWSGDIVWLLSPSPSDLEVAVWGVWVGCLHNPSVPRWFRSAPAPGTCRTPGPGSSCRRRPSPAPAPTGSAAPGSCVYAGPDTASVGHSADVRTSDSEMQTYEFQGQFAENCSTTAPIQSLNV